MGTGLGDEDTAAKKIAAVGGKVTFDRENKKKTVGGVILTGAKVTDAALKDLLEFPSLTHVEIKNATKVTADGLSILGKVKKLSFVEISGPIADDQIAKTLASVPTITELRLNNGNLTDDGVKALAALTKLETVTFSQNKNLKGTSIPGLTAAKGLKYLTVTNCQLGDLEGWGALRNLKGLTGMSLSKGGVTDAGMKEVGKLTQLKNLNLDGNPITDAGLAEISGLRLLDNLSLADTKITEKAVPTLSKFTKLSFLTVNEKQIGKAGGEALKKALPNCDVNVMP
jgi:Leucine-rich repeat (LRR) protein